MYAAGTSSGVARPKFWEGPNILTLNEQQYLVWECLLMYKTTRHARKLGVWPLFPPGYAYRHKWRQTIETSL